MANEPQLTPTHPETPPNCDRFTIQLDGHHRFDGMKIKDIASGNYQPKYRIDCAANAVMAWLRERDRCRGERYIVSTRPEHHAEAQMSEWELWGRGKWTPNGAAGGT